jgi:hypothetical protein
MPWLMVMRGNRNKVHERHAALGCSERFNFRAIRSWCRPDTRKIMRQWLRRK